jgi:general stress protein 26
MDHSNSIKRDRPAFLKAYGIHPEQESGLLPWSWVAERMTKSHNYWVSSTQANGKPHAAPVWGLYLDYVFYFGTNENSLKAKNLLSNPASVIHLESGDETVIFEGKAVPFKDKGMLSIISALYEQKYPGSQLLSESEPGTIVFAVEPVLVFAWTEADFFNTPTRWSFA